LYSNCNGLLVAHPDRLSDTWPHCVSDGNGELTEDERRVIREAEADLLCLATALEARQDEEGDEPHTVPADAPTAPNVIRRLGADWEIRFGAELGCFPVKDFGGIESLTKLVTRPQQPVPLADLVDSETRPLVEQAGSLADVLDNSAIAELKRQYEELERGKSAAEDPLVRAENEAERMAICAELKKTIGPMGRKRKLGSTAADQAWDALAKKLRRLCPRLRAAGMPELAAHMEKAIDIDRPHITYRPPANAAPWRVET